MTDGPLAAIDLLGKLLTYIPESRISAKQGLDHPWLLTFADPEEESLSPKPRPFTRWQDIESLETVDEFRDAIWIEIQVSKSEPPSSGIIELKSLAGLSEVCSISSGRVSGYPRWPGYKGVCRSARPYSKRSFRTRPRTCYRFPG